MLQFWLVGGFIRCPPRCVQESEKASRVTRVHAIREGVPRCSFLQAADGHGSIALQVSGTHSQNRTSCGGVFVFMPTCIGFEATFLQLHKSLEPFTNIHFCPSCRDLEVCEVYYNVGRSGIRSDIPLWIHKFISGCPRIKTFTLWTPSGDCGGFDNACLAAVCRGWEGLEFLEVSGEGMNLDGECHSIAAHMQASLE